MRVLCALAVAVVGVGSACSAGTQGTAVKATTTSSTRPPGSCPPLPPPTGTTLTWYPADLPVPAGSYVLDDLSLANLPYHSGDYIVPKTIEAYIRFVLAEWPKRGWVLGRGESEPGEAELAFTRGSVQGALRIRSAFCDRSHTLLVVSFGGSAPALGQGTTTTSTSFPLLRP
jgi:hypothetical protein